MTNLDAFSDKKIEMTQKELTFIKDAERVKGWRRGLLVGLITLIIVEVFTLILIFNEHTLQ